MVCARSCLSAVLWRSATSAWVFSSIYHQISLFSHWQWGDGMGADPKALRSSCWRWGSDYHRGVREVIWGWAKLNQSQEQTSTWPDRRRTHAESGVVFLSLLLGQGRSCADVLLAGTAALPDLVSASEQSFSECVWSKQHWLCLVNS